MFSRQECCKSRDHVKFARRMKAFLTKDVPCILAIDDCQALLSSSKVRRTLQKSLSQRTKSTLVFLAGSVHTLACITPHFPTVSGACDI